MGLSESDIEVLRGMTPEMLAGVPEPLRGAVDRVVAAVRAGASEEALRALGEGPEGAGELEAELKAFLSAAGQRLSEALGPGAQVQARLARAAAEEAALREELRAANLPDELQRAVDEVLDGADIQALQAQMAALVAQVQQGGAELQAALASGDAAAARGAAQAFAGKSGQLLGETSTIERSLSALQALLPRLQRVLQARMAESGLDAAALRARAEVAEREAAKAHRVMDMVPVWSQVFDVAEREGNPEIMDRAGQLLVAVALDAGDHDAMLALVERKLAVADSPDWNARFSVERGTTLSRMGRHDDAHMVLLNAQGMAKASGDRRLIARAQLALGDMLEAADAHDEAARTYGALLDSLNDSPDGLLDVAGRAALGLAISLNDDEAQADRRSEALRVSAKISQHIGDVRTFVAATLGRVFDLAERGAHAEALQTLFDGEPKAVAMHPQAGQAFQQAVGALREQLGEAAFNQTLRQVRSVS